MNKRQCVDGEGRLGGHDRLLDGICLLGLASREDILEVPRRDEEDADVRGDLRVREDELVLGRDGH